MLTARSPQTDLGDPWFAGLGRTRVRFFDDPTDVVRRRRSSPPYLAYLLRSSPGSQQELEGRAQRYGRPRFQVGTTILFHSLSQDGVSVLQYLVRLKPGVQPGVMWTRFARRAVTTSRPPSYGHSGVEPGGGNRHETRPSRTALLCGGAPLNHPGEDGWAGSSPRRTTGSGPLLLP